MMITNKNAPAKIVRKARELDAPCAMAKRLLTRESPILEIPITVTPSFYPVNLRRITDDLRIPLLMYFPNKRDGNFKLPAYLSIEYLADGIPWCKIYINAHADYAASHFAAAYLLGISLFMDDDTKKKYLGNDRKYAYPYALDDSSLSRDAYKFALYLLMPEPYFSDEYNDIYMGIERDWDVEVKSVTVATRAALSNLFGAPPHEVSRRVNLDIFKPDAPEEEYIVEIAN